MARILDAVNRKRGQQAAPAPSLSRPLPMTGISITYKEVGALSFASRLIPERTPKRWELISKLVSDCMIDNDLSSPVLAVCKCNDGKRLFNHTAEDCKHVTQILSERYPGTLGFSDEKLRAVLSTYPERIALKHIILTPQIEECCGEPIIMCNRPSFPLVYTTQGTFVAALFNGECRKGCSKKFHYSYYQQGDVTKYYIPQGEKYFQYSSQTVFETALLEDVTNNISISATSFESRAEVYNENFRDLDIARLKYLREFGRTTSDTNHPWKLTEKRVEDAWFLYTLVCFYRDRRQLDEVNFATSSLPSQRKDLDMLCGRAWELISQTTNPWIHHKCGKLGCSEGTFRSISYPNLTHPSYYSSINLKLYML